MLVPLVVVMRSSRKDERYDYAVYSGEGGYSSGKYLGGELIRRLWKQRAAEPFL